MSDDRIDLGDGFHLGPAYIVNIAGVWPDPPIPHRDLFYDRGDGSTLHRVGAADAGLMAMWIGKRPFRGYRPSPYARCSICSAPLDVPGRPRSQDCGGDCIACMAEMDPDDFDIGPAVAAMRAGDDRIALKELHRLSKSASKGQATPRPWMTGSGDLVSEVVIGDHSLSDMHDCADAEFLAACWNYVRSFVTLRDALLPEKGEEG